MPGPTHDTLLEEGLEAGRGTRAGLIDEVANIPAEKMDFRATDVSRTVEELVRHIVEVTLMIGARARPDEADPGRRVKRRVRPIEYR